MNFLPKFFFFGFIRNFTRKKANEISIGRGSAKGESLINPLDLYALLPDNSILVADGGDFVGCAANTMSPRGPLRWLDPGAFGTLGVGGGFALAAKLCKPDAEVWIISGYSLAEYDTYKRHKTPIGGLIGNDACWIDVACPLDYCAYENVAKGYGGNGIECRKPDEKEIRQVISLYKMASGEPMVVNAWIGKTNFREGSISV
eukprot:GSMAST32.ASY1.ANO1.2007.1 assembled CDS